MERNADELKTLPPFLRPLAGASLRSLRQWDFSTAARVDRFLANSQTTRKRIASHYRRESEVLYPPIRTDFFTPAGDPSDYYLFAARPVPYKRIDIAIAATALLGKRLVVAGGGHIAASLRAPHVELRGQVSDIELRDLMRGARGLLFPQIEDFGMTPLEMMACGRPVVAYGKGGASETVLDGVTGVLAQEQSAEVFANAILRLESLSLDPQDAREQAERFSTERFTVALRRAITGTSIYGEFRNVSEIMN